MNGFDMQDPYAAQIQAGVQQQLAQNAARRDPFSPEALGVGQAPMQAPARQGFGQRMTGLLGQIGTGVRNYLSDDENRARLAMAFNTMRLTPDQGLASALQSRIENAQATRLANAQANRTVQALRDANRNDLADLVEANPTMAAEIYKEHLRQLSSDGAYMTLTGKDLNQRYPGAAYPEGALFKMDSRTGEITQIQGMQESPAEQRAYEYYVQQERNAGREPVSFFEFKRQPPVSDTSRQRDYEYYAQQERKAGKEPGSFVEFLQSTQQDRPLTQDESISLGFYNRALDAQTQLDSMIDLGGQSMPVEMVGKSYSDVMANKFPGFGLERYFVSDAYKLFDQARRNFINAILRKESGAAISASEFENADLQYFPVPGDTPEVLAQKRQNRQRAIESLQYSAGRALERNPRQEIPGQGPVSRSVGRVGTQVTVYENGIPRVWSFPNETQAEQFEQAMKAQ